MTCDIVIRGGQGVTASRTDPAGIAFQAGRIGVNLPLNFRALEHFRRRLERFSVLARQSPLNFRALEHFREMIRIPQLRRAELINREFAQLSAARPRSP